MISEGFNRTAPNRRSKAGFSLVEVVFVIVLATIVMSATILGYLHCARRAEWAAYYLAAQGLAMQCLEETRVARWDTQAFPQLPEHNQCVSSNFPSSVEILDVPVSGSTTNVVSVSVSISITDISSTPPLKQIKIDCVWPFFNKLFTNTVVSYRAPDQ
jgi:prepilin-type N-terminal cleavage/methylation domain-containing protein